MAIIVFSHVFQENALIVLDNSIIFLAARLERFSWSIKYKLISLSFMASVHTQMQS